MNNNIENAKGWTEADKKDWYNKQTIKRSYADEVLTKISKIKQIAEVRQYGALTIAPERYPLFLIKSKQWREENLTVLITGGVHGYETSGVQGALQFISTEMPQFENDFNFIIAPCVSPWGYETINRWNSDAIDPNRSFFQDTDVEESQYLMSAVASESLNIDVHIDLHETTDTDNTVFRPALAARDGITQDKWDIPDGFYLVGDTDNPQSEFQKAMIESVEKVTHIAPADEQGRIIGEPITQKGVINYDVKSLGLCAGFSNAKYCTTTEVYPDSPKVTDQNCNDAQVAAICGALNYLKSDQN